MVGSENLRTFGMKLAVAHALAIDLVHQLADEVKAKSGLSKSGDAILRREEDLGVFDCVLEIIFAPHFSEKDQGFFGAAPGSLSKEEEPAVFRAEEMPNDSRNGWMERSRPRKSRIEVSISREPPGA